MEALETGLGGQSRQAAAAHCSSGGKSAGDPEFRRCMPEREERCGLAPGSFVLRGLKAGVLGVDLNRIFTSFMLLCQNELCPFTLSGLGCGWH